MSDSKTIGAIRTNLNSNSDPAHELKTKVAQLIDLCESLRKTATTNEQQRAISIAQTHFETGSMFAVKAHY